MLAAVTLTASTITDPPAADAGAAAGSDQDQVAKLRTQIRFYRGRAVHRARWLGILLHPRHLERSTTSVAYLTWMRDVWHTRAHRYGQKLRHRLPVYSALLCIHRYEGGWTAYSPAGPYYGGLQMDPSFMARYGSTFLARFGDARHWRPGLQVAAGYRAVRERGYTPWPVSRQACGV